MNSSNLDEFYDDLWINRWSDMERYNPTALHLKLKICEIISRLPEITSLLDAGCGAGYNVADISHKFPDLKIAGADLTQSICDIAKKFNSCNANVNFYPLDLSKSHLEHKYDLVLCNQVLEHIDNDFDAISNLRKMSNKYVLITVPSGKYNSTSKLVGHVRHYTAEELVAKVSASGLQVIEVKSWGFPFHSIYKFLLALLPEKAQSQVGFGCYGFFKKSLSAMLFYAFKLNRFNYGANIILLAKVV